MSVTCSSLMTDFKSIDLECITDVIGNRVSNHKHRIFIIFFLFKEEALFMLCKVFYVIISMLSRDSCWVLKSMPLKEIKL